MVLNDSLNDENGEHLFVEVTKNAEWSLKAVGGNSTQRGQCKAVNVLKTLQAKTTGSSAVAEPPTINSPAFVKSPSITPTPSTAPP